jgi:hypothetical protein
MTMVRHFFLVWLLALSLASVSAQPSAGEKPVLIVVKGAAGEEEFGKLFTEWAGRWEAAAKKAGVTTRKIGFEEPGSTADKEQLRQAIETEGKTASGELWLVLIGHGTFDGKEAKFNLRGPDFSASELAKWLEPLKRPIAIVDTSSASAPFLTTLSRKDRVLITSTRSGQEQNFSRFGEYLSEAISDPTADLDKDGQTSLLEAFLMASRRLTAFYDSDRRLATEHPLLDDNGDGLGTAPDWFRGIYAVKRAKDGAELDGFRAHQWHLIRSATEQQWSLELRARRDKIEQSIAELRQTKSQSSEDEYYRKLEPLLTDLSLLYEEQSKNSQATGK